MLFRQFHQFLEFRVRIRGAAIKHKYRNFCGAKRLNWNSTPPFEIAPLSRVASLYLSLSLTHTHTHTPVLSSGLFVINNDTGFPNQSSTTSMHNIHVHSSKLKHRCTYLVCVTSWLFQTSVYFHASRVPPSWDPNKYGPSHSKNSFSEDRNLVSGFFDKCVLNELSIALV